MNSKYYANKYASNLEDSDDDEDDDYEDYMEEIDNYNNKSNYLYKGKSNDKLTPYGFQSTEANATGGLNKYDVNNPGYRMSSINMVNEKMGTGTGGNIKYTSMLESKKNPKKFTNPIYDYNLGGNYNISSGYNLSTTKDNYNIDIDLNKIKKDNENPSSDIFNKEDKYTNKKTNEPKTKIRRDFLDDLENQLDLEQKKEEEQTNAAAVDEELERKYLENENKYTYNDYDEDHSEDIKENNSLIYHLDSDKKKNYETNSNNTDAKSIDASNHTITGKDNKDSYHNYENFDIDNNKNDSDDYSYNKFTESRENPSGGKQEEPVTIYDANKMEEYLKKTGALLGNNNHSTTKNKLNESENFIKENSVDDQKYNDFENNSKLLAGQSDVDDVYNKFEADVISNLAESNNENPLLNLAKSSTSNDYRNLIISSSGEINSNREANNEVNNVAKSKDPIQNINIITSQVKSENKNDVSSNVNFASPSHHDKISPDKSHNNFEINYNHEYIKNIIAEEFKRITNNFGLVNESSASNTNNILKSFSQNATNLNLAKEEHHNRIRCSSYIIDYSQNFLIHSNNNYSNYTNIYDKNRLRISKSVELFFDSTMLHKKNIREMKLQSTIDEERKRREYFEINYMRLKETNEELETQIRKYKRIEIENSELKKMSIDTEHKYKELEVDLINLKKDYEVKLKLVEERIILRESKNEARKISEVQRNFDIEIENLKCEINEKKSECNDLKNKSEYLEKENTKLSINKISNLETNDKIKELRNENFVLHERCNELTARFDRLNVEKEKLEKKNSEKLLDKDFHKFNYNKDRIIKINTKEIVDNSVSYSYDKKSLSIFDQILLERDHNVQETIIKSYSKEIEKLNNEIKLLKNITGENKTNLKNTKFLNQKEKLYNNFTGEENFVKHSAEEKIKKLKMIINDSDSKSGLNFDTVQNEFSIYEKFINTTDRENLQSGEIDLESYLNIFVNKLKVSLPKYEMIEIYNNFQKTNNNNIRYIDLLNAIRSKDPYNFFIQPDPSYLKEIEKKLINNDNNLKELEKNLEISKNIERDLKYKISTLENENCNLLSKLNMNQGNENLLINNLLKNNFLNTTNVGLAKNTQEDGSIKKLKEKIKSLETANTLNIAEFEKKVKQYEEKFNGLKTSLETGYIDKYDAENIKLNSDKNLLKEENFQIKTKHAEIEMNLKNEISNCKNKLIKYKNNYKTIKEKLSKSEKEKEKILRALNNKNIEINPNLIQNFIINSEELELMTRKVNELEKKNIDREEHYKQLCYNSNSYQVNKELEALNKKFENERKDYIKTIQHKTNELLIIKKEFEEIYRELEEIKYSKKK